MGNSEAKLHLSLEDGVFEISGSELFVSQQIENFKDIILEALSSKRERLDNRSTDVAIASPPAAAPLPEEEQVGGRIERKNYDRVFHIEGDHVRIIKKIPGANTAKKTVNTALAYLWAKRSVGAESVSSQEIRDVCEEQSCLDPSNFSATLRNAKEYLIVDGKRNSSDKVCKLTIPGVEQAEALLEGLNGA
ncbi:MAG: hypothetical protein CMO07_17145 [Thalassospira sp.]|uniref:hypothetical protein n=1 Tax=Thalassospira sp. UBA4513 TaxID=1947675 RepID=UPI000C515FE6|nr:hypothetical protein [Thalassospira sp. UBA4513]MBE72397.1 hypothetical protein [Thalassospira sp.]|tara:strand:- start:314 stop:886 length:573 start_codon:yes stop_codon:yes gene_type:complete